MRRPGSAYAHRTGLARSLYLVMKRRSLRARSVTEVKLPRASRSRFTFALLHSLRFLVRSRAALHLEVIALRHQLAVVNRSRRPRLRLMPADRMLWAWLSQAWPGWRPALHMVRPETVIGWHRRGFRLLWTWKSRPRTGRPGVPPDVRTLIRELSTANLLWGAPRIHGELLKLGISVSQSTVAKYMRRQARPPSQTWRTFLTNHTRQIMAVDLFVVPTVTFRLLFVLIILAHNRRRIVHVAVTDHPTAAWTAQQLRNAFPDHDAPGYLLHDRDAVFAAVATTIAGMNIQAVRTAPRAPWQNAYVERVIGSIRRECLDHVIVVNAVGLHRVLTEYVAYYMRARTHLALGKDAPIARPIAPPSAGRIVATPHVGGLHHRYDRAAA
jgi:putative transposase